MNVIFFLLYCVSQFETLFLHMIFFFQFPDNPKGFKIVKGKPVTKVNSSKFCLGRLLKIRNRVREIAHSQYHVEVLHGSISRYHLIIIFSVQIQGSLGLCKCV